jgi:branched-chain amino acid transport system substrate-binding protein
MDRASAGGALLLVLMMLLTACGGTNGGADQGSGGEGGTVTFGVSGPLTGDAASYGENLKRGIDLAVEEINKQGGIDGQQVELRYYDDKCDPTEGANVASRIAADDSIFAMLGPVCSSTAQAMLPVLERANLSVLSGSTSSPLLSGAFPNFARTIPSDAQVAVNMANLAVSVLDHQNIAILYASDDFGQPIKEGIEAQVEELGGSIVAAESFVPAKTKDFTPALTKIAAKNPDAVMMVGYYNDVGLALSQFANAGLNDVPTVSTPGVDHPDFIKLAGDAAEDQIVFSYYNFSSQLPANVEFVEAFQKKYNELPNEQAAYGYELPFIYKAAIEDGATSEDLIEKVKTITYEGPTGTTSFQENGDVEGKAGVVLRVEDGEFVADLDLTEQVSELG